MELFMKLRISNLRRPFILRIDDNDNGIISFNGHLIEINSTTIEIIQYLNDGMTFDDIVSTIMSSYNAEKEEIESDVVGILDELKRYGILDDDSIIRST